MYVYIYIYIYIHTHPYAQTAQQESMNTCKPDLTTSNACWIRVNIQTHKQTIYIYIYNIIPIYIYMYVIYIYIYICK